MQGRVDYPSLGLSLNGLGLCYAEQGNDGEASAWLTRAREVAERQR